MKSDRCAVVEVPFRREGNLNIGKKSESTSPPHFIFGFLPGLPSRAVCQHVQRKAFQPKVQLGVDNRQNKDRKEKVPYLQEEDVPSALEKLRLAYVLWNKRVPPYGAPNYRFGDVDDNSQEPAGGKQNVGFSLGFYRCTPQAHINLNEAVEGDQYQHEGGDVQKRQLDGCIDLAKHGPQRPARGKKSGH